MHFKKTIHHILFACTVSISISANASINNITFSGKWLLRPSSNSQTQYKINACNVPVFDYSKTPSGEKNALVEIGYQNQYKGYYANQSIDTADITERELSAMEETLILDSLRFAPSPSNIPFLLEKYKGASNSTDKLMILSALIPSLQDVKKEELSPTMSKSIEDIYDELIKNQDDQKLYERAVEDLPVIYSRKEAATLLKLYGPNMQTETKKTLRRAFINTYFLTATSDAQEEDLDHVVSMMNGCELQDHLKIVSSLVDMGQLPASTTKLFEARSVQNPHLPNCIHWRLSINRGKLHF